MKPLWPVFIGVLLFFFAPSARAAMEFKIDGIENNPAEINFDQTIEILYSFSGVSPPKTYYLAGVFQKEAGSNYFGYTWNNNWYKYGDDYTNFFKIEIAESSTSGKLKIKPDVDSSGFKGNGDYQIKLFRYCSSQNSCGDTNLVSIKINAPPSPSPSPSPSQTSGTNSGQPSPSPSPSQAASPLPSPSLSPSPKPSARTKNIVLLTSQTPEPVLGTQNVQPEKPKTVDWPLIIMLLSTGGGILSITAVIIFRLCRKN